MLVGGIILLLVALGMAYWRVLSRRRVADLLAADTRSLGELCQEVAEVAAEIGPGSYARYVCVQGVILSPEALEAPVSGTRCVHYTHRITRLTEEERRVRDETGEVISRKDRREEVLSDEVRTAPDLRVEDASGAVPLDLEGAQLDLEETANRFEPSRTGKSSLRVGSLTLSTRPVGAAATVGYRVQEHVLPVGKQVTVVGELSDEGGSPRLRHPGDRRLHAVSLKSRSELLAGTERSIRVAGALGIVSAAAGLALLIAGLLR